MPVASVVRFVAASLLWLAALPVVAHAQPVSLGPEFVVFGASFEYAGRYGIDVGSDADGAFVVVWSGRDDNYEGVQARRYNSSGTALGSEFVVNSYTTGRQGYAFPKQGVAVAADADGDFIVVWAGFGGGDFLDIFGRRFDSGALGGDFMVNTYTTGTQGYLGVDVAADADGDFVVIWTDGFGTGYGH